MQQLEKAMEALRDHHYLILCGCSSRSVVDENAFVKYVLDPWDPSADCLKLRLRGIEVHVTNPHSLREIPLVGRRPGICHSGII